MSTFAGFEKGRPKDAVFAAKTQPSKKGLISPGNRLRTAR